VEKRGKGGKKEREVKVKGKRGRKRSKVRKGERVKGEEEG
jgi:hypothetical protein